MKAFVISLPRSASRRASMAEQLARTELESEFVDGIDGRALTASERAELVSEDAVARYPHWLTPGSIGCSLSHLRAYRRMIAAGDDVALILEDDARVPVTVAETCRRVAALMHGSEIVLLYFRAFGTCKFSTQDSVELGSGARLMYPMDGRQPITSTAYLITASACRELAEVIVPVRVGADSWGHFYELGALESLRCVLPRVVTVRKDFKTTIGHAAPGSARAHVTDFVSRQRLVGASRLLTLNRHFVEWRMSKTALVPERSSIALARTAAGR